MQPAATALYNVLEVGIGGGTIGPVVRDLAWLFEFYEYDVTPGDNGFDPSQAAQRFASIEITWLGYAYRRVVLNASPLTKAKGAQANRCTLRLSNADENRYAATWVTQNQVEGMRLVVRLISRSASTTLAASNIRFSGRCDNPEGFDVIQGSVSATEDVGGDDFELPPRLFLPDDPEGRSPSDPLNEGFPLVVLRGSFQYIRPEPDKSYSRADLRRYFATQPYSSYDDTQLGEPIPMILGRSQIRMNRGLFMDEGRVTRCLDWACMGPIAGFLYFRMNMDADYARYFSQPQSVTYHLGEAGGTGTQTADPLWPNHPLFSYTAYVSFRHVYIGTGAFTNIDAGHETVATILGLTMETPNSSGVFSGGDWSDDGTLQVRHLLTHPRFFGHDEAFIEDSAAYATYLYNTEPLVDQSNSGLILIPDPDLASAGDAFLRYRATGLINAPRARYILGLDVVRPEGVDAGDFEGYDPLDPPTVSVDVTRLIKRFTSNVLLKKRVKAKDFLYKTLLPSFRGYLVTNWRAKWDIRSERPADFAHLRAATIAGATTLPIEDVTPWKAATNPLWGQIIVGTPLTSSEVRKVSSAAYTSDANAITLSAGKTGGVTVTASGLTLAGGNSTTQATGTVTIGGAPAAGDTVTVTIQGIAVTYTVESDETTATVAYMVAAHINANTQLRRFVSASASGSVVTVSSRWGVLTLSSALVNAHGGPVANPTSAPSISASGAGSSLAAGTYRVAYANRNADGSTYASPHSSVTVTAGQNIAVAAVALPAGVTSRDWFVSKGADDPEMVLYVNTNGPGFSVTAPPSSTATFPPEYNTTGEEVVRVAMPFASNNQTPAILAQANLPRGNIFAESYKWPGGREQASYTEVVGNYVSAKDDFAPSKAIVVNDAKRARLGKVSPKEMDLTAVDNYHQARRLVYFDSAKFIDHHWFNSFGSNGLALLLEEGDVICASDDSGGHVNVLTQVEEFSINLADFTVSINRARLYATSMFRELVPRTSPLLPSVLQWTATLGTEVQLLDLPAWSDAVAAKGGISVAIRRAAGVGDWRGAGIYLDAGGGHSRIMEWDVEATTGELVTDLPADSTSAFDEVSAVRVTVRGGKTLSSASEAEVLAGANLARAGSRIFKFKTATLVSEVTTPGYETKTYDLGGLLVGLSGTAGESSDVGDEFTLLDGAVFQIPLDASLVGEVVKVVALTVNQDFADATEYSLTWAGKSRRYGRPANLRLSRFDGSTGSPLLVSFDEPGGATLAPYERYVVRINGDVRAHTVQGDYAEAAQWYIPDTDPSLTSINPALLSLSETGTLTSDANTSQFGLVRARQIIYGDCRVRFKLDSRLPPLLIGTASAVVACEVDADTDEFIAVDHYFAEGDLVNFLGGIPTTSPAINGDEYGTGNYYVRNPTSDRFQISELPSSAIMDITAAGSGQLYFQYTAGPFAQLNAVISGGVAYVKPELADLLKVRALAGGECVMEMKSGRVNYYVNDLQTPRFVSGASPWRHPYSLYAQLGLLDGSEQAAVGVTIEHANPRSFLYTREMQENDFPGGVPATVTVTVSRLSDVGEGMAAEATG